MKKVILRLCVLILGVGSYFYFFNMEEKGFKPSNLSILEKVERNKLIKNKQSLVKKKTKIKNIEIVKGYKLPPEPDKALNDSTLLGIDANNNMLRDDVERWIVKQDWSPKRIAASLQKARGYQLTINEDIGSTDKRADLLSMSNSVLESVQGEKRSLKEIINSHKLFKKKVFNTKERKIAFKNYDRSFSGTVIKAFPNAGKFSYKYADYTMVSGRLDSYEFNSEKYTSLELLPIYSRSNGLITSHWDLETNKEIIFKGDWNNNYCKVNFNIEKMGLECSTARKDYMKEIGKI